MLIAKHFDPVLGIDIHILITPAGPIPIPHPHIALILDPIDYIPVFNLGATVWVGGVPRADAGTAGFPIPHFPLGGSFVKPPMNENEIFMGSSTVIADGAPLSFTALPALSCHDIGMIAPIRSKKPKKSYGMVLPTSVLLAIPVGMPVMVGGPPTVDMMALAMRGGMSALGGIFKKLRKMQKKSPRMKKISDAVHKRAENAMENLGVPANVRNRVHRGICTVTGHPVDVASGKVFTDQIDFELPGPIPLIWERTWNSTSSYSGPLGHGWHHAYDMALQEENNAVALRLPDGRGVAFPALKEYELCFHRDERLTLSRNEHGYAVDDHKGMRYQFSPDTNHQNRHHLWFIKEKSSQAQITFFNDSNDRLIGIIDSSGRKLRIQNFDDGTIHKIYLPHPSDIDSYFCAVEYAYTNGDLVSASDALNNSMRYHYQNHLLVKETNRNNLSFYFEYNGSDHNAYCTRTWGDGGIYDHKLFYDLDKKVTIVEDSLGNKTTHFHNGAVVHETVAADGSSTITKRNLHNDIIERIDPLGNKTSYEYSDSGYLTAITNPGGGSKNFSYDYNNNMTQYSNEINASWTMEYDARNRLIRMVDPLGVVTHYLYEDNLLHRINTGNDKTQVLLYDSHQNIHTIMESDEVISRYRYDALGNPIEIIDNKGNHTFIKYNLCGKVTYVKEKDSTIRQFKYDPEGNLTQLLENDLSVEYTYTGLDRIKTKSENGVCIHYRYNTEEKLTHIINANGEEYSFFYDQRLNISEEIGFDGLIKRYTRDKNGNIIRIDRDNGRFTCYTRDAAGNILKSEHSDGLIEEYTYRADGEMLAARNNYFAVEFELDKLGNIVKEKQDGVEISSLYDIHGNRKVVESTLGAFQLIKRDPQGFVSELYHGKQSHRISLKRDQQGNELMRAVPGGVVREWKRDQLGRPTEETIAVEHVVAHTKQYFWKNLSDVYKVTADGVSTTFMHDQSGNPMALQRSNGEIESRYLGKTGQIYEQPGEADRRYSPGGRLQTLGRKSSDEVRWAYDSDGNLISRIDRNSAWKYEWNDAGFLTKVVRPDEKTVEFTYDALGRRKAKVFNGKITRWIWDGENILHEWTEDSATGKKRNNASAVTQIKQHFIADMPEQSEIITWYFEPESYSPVCKQVNDQYFSLLTDQLGAPVKMYNAGGHEVWSVQSRLNGSVIRHNGAIEDCPFRWPGQYEDIETGLHYNRFRYYSPETGQYISQDPLGLAAEKVNLYGYVNNVFFEFDPLGLVDGGSHWKVRTTNTGGQVNHMPANSVSPVSHGRGPSTWMTVADHQKTASWGSRAGAVRWRAEQKALIARGKFGKAMEMDIRDVQRHFGSRYNQGIREMIDYAADQAFITRKEANRLKRRYCR